MIADRFFEVSVMVMEAKPKPGIRKQVEERHEQGVCLLCEKRAWKRGVCTTHYSRWRTARADVPNRERPAFDAQQIRDGKLLPDRQGQRDVENEFRVQS